MRCWRGLIANLLFLSLSSPHSTTAVSIATRLAHRFRRNPTFRAGRGRRLQSMGGHAVDLSCGPGIDFGSTRSTQCESGLIVLEHCAKRLNRGIPSNREL